jgi:spermidine synthase
MNFGISIILVFLSGFLALSFEILWFRIYSIITYGTIISFGLVLGIYLTGIAIGSFISSKFSKKNKDKDKMLKTLFYLTLFVTILGFLFIPISSIMVTTISYHYTFILLLIITTINGATFPIISHLSIEANNKSGEKISYLYFSNIVGSFLGSLITGFTLLEYFTLKQTSIFLLIVGFLISLTIFFTTDLKINNKKLLIISITYLLFILLISNKIYDKVYERLTFKKNYSSSDQFKYIHENRDGVILVTKDDELFGNGVYDGFFSVSLKNDVNMLSRAVYFNAYKKNLDDVVMIGLGSGSWGQILANNPKIKHLTIIEINPGYLDIIPKYPDIKSLLTNPKVKIVIDDGRRWLNVNKKKKFDMVIMNTTWHWKAYIANLTSYEFQNKIKKHLKKGGIFYYNTTNSLELQKTSCISYKNGIRYINFMLLSDSKLEYDKEYYFDLLKNYKIDNTNILSYPSDKKNFDDLLDNTTFVEGCDSILKRSKNVEVTTEDNINIEFKKSDSKNTSIIYPTSYYLKNQ